MYRTFNRIFRYIASRTNAHPNGRFGIDPLDVVATMAPAASTRRTSVLKPSSNSTVPVAWIIEPTTDSRFQNSIIFLKTSGALLAFVSGTFRTHAYYLGIKNTFLGDRISVTLIFICFVKDYTRNVLGARTFF